MENQGTTCLRVPAMATLGAMWALVTFAAIALWQKAPPFIDASYGSGHQPFELLGMFLSLLILGFATFYVWNRNQREPKSIATVGLWVLPVFAAVHQVSEYATPSWDWKCYVGGAEALMTGSSPYVDCYLYPPLVAQVMAGAYPSFAWVGEFLALSSPKHWMLVFFVWHSFQVLMVALLVYLLNRLVLRQGLDAFIAAAVVAALLVVCTPLERTIRHNQVNLVVLNAILLGVDRSHVRPAVSGMLIAIASHIKLLPVAVFAPFMMARKWRVVLPGLVAVVAIAVAQVMFATPSTMWAEFFVQGPQFVSGEYFRDNSFTGFVFNAVRVPVDLMGGSIRGWQEPLRLIGAAVSLGVAAVVFLRLRERDEPDDLGALGMALMLLLSPVAWEHHYVWALPLLALTAARKGRQHPLSVGVCVLLICGLPTFDVFPLSYHRLVGLLLLIRLELVQGTQR